MGSIHLAACKGRARLEILDWGWPGCRPLVAVHVPAASEPDLQSQQSTPDQVTVTRTKFVSGEATGHSDRVCDWLGWFTDRQAGRQAFQVVTVDESAELLSHSTVRARGWGRQVAATVSLPSPKSDGCWPTFFQVSPVARNRVSL